MPSRSTSSPTRLYLDSNIFIAVFAKENAKPLKDGVEDRLTPCARILQEAENGKIEIYTSDITRLECPSKHPSIQESMRETVSLFFEHEWITTIEIDPFILASAKLLQERGYVRGIGAADYIHIASALSIEGLSAFFSYDEVPTNIASRELGAGVRCEKPTLFWTSLSIEFPELRRKVRRLNDDD